MEVNAEKAGLDPNRLETISRHLMENYITPGKIAGCQVMVSRGGVPAYFRSFGQMDIERDKPVQEDTIFRIYSMTKPITSVALMMLFEEGRFQLNDPVSRFIPSWKGQQVWVSGDGDDMETREPASPMTMRHVLSHTSGLTYGSGLFPAEHPVDKVYDKLGVNRDAGETIESFAQKLSTVPLRYDPGTQWCYSLATDVCGCLVEFISGVPFAQFLQERIFDPLGMTDTSFVVPEEKLDRLAANYGRRADKTLKLLDDPMNSLYANPNRFPSGGGGLASTTADYGRFCEMLRGGGQFEGQRIIGGRTLKLMHRNHLPNGTDLGSIAMGSFSETAYDGVGFGLGFASTLDDVAAGTIGAGDYYWGGAASTIFWVDPVEDMFVIFMTQLMPSATFNFRGQIKNIIYGAIED
ncbi:MAG TPA: class A beta-lactamase-related serine hydrolase [Gammaproteobacteria bacterium]|jgi:CubicO group peptidase (beta-lactamase class C family)|nr:class A beta-lactamase-related serine hydrolase [Gammaproteobacteria bacterium]